jgi:hypothetical protein
MRGGDRGSWSHPVTENTLNGRSTIMSIASSWSPWSNERSDQAVLTGDALAKVKAMALDEVPGGTLVRIETAADGQVAYEAHVLTADGTPATVYLDASFDFVRLEPR